MWKSLLRPALLALAACAATARAEPPTVNVYTWNDYFAEDTLTRFETKTGIKPVVDLYDANEVLDAKLLAGRSGYDLVFPTARPFGARHIKAGLYRELDRSRLPGWSNLDPRILETLQGLDPGHRYLVPYMWGTTGLGLNVAKVRAALGADAPLDTWALLFDPKNAERLAGCGISLMDDPAEVIPAALVYLGKDPNSLAAADLEAARVAIQAVRPHVRYFHSSQYIADLANGDLCLAHAYSGDALQARDRADEARNGVEIRYQIPREGAVLWIDTMAIPKDAPHPDQAHALIEHLLDPQVIAAVSDHVSYANANRAAPEFMNPALRDDPSVYPGPEVRAKLFAPAAERSDQELRALNRLWTRIKANR